MLGEPAEKMFFGAMNLYRFDPAEHLLRFAEQGADRYS